LLELNKDLFTIVKSEVYYSLVVVASCGVLLEPADCGLGQFSVGVPCLDPIGGIFGLVHRGSGFLAPDLAIEPSAPFTIISN
jgi:hypothetical protein